MPPARRLGPDDKARTSLVCSKQQKALLMAEAKRAGCDLNTLILAHTLAGVARTSGAPIEDAPVIMNGDVGAKLRTRAAEQGVPPERLLEMLLIAGG